MDADNAAISTNVLFEYDLLFLVEGVPDRAEKYHNLVLRERRIGEMPVI
jgi:hypothetical protein